jgi:hypothetical protein
MAFSFGSNPICTIIMLCPVFCSRQCNQIHTTHQFFVCLQGCQLSILRPPPNHSQDLQPSFISENLILFILLNLLSSRFNSLYVSFSSPFLAFFSRQLWLLPILVVYIFLPPSIYLYTFSTCNAIIISST